MPTGPYCGGCLNQPFGRRFIEADGDGDILFLGDSPWKDEAAAGRNFSGAAGYVYEKKWLSWLGLPRQGVITANSMWCSPPSLGWTDKADKIPEAYASLQHCRPYLDELIARKKPKVIVPMGNVALGRAVGLTGIEKYQGYVHESVWGIPAVPTFHPSYIMQGKHKLSPMIISALRRAKRIADGTYQESSYQLILDPSPDELRAYLSKFPHDLGDVDVDIETPDSSTLDEDDLDLDAEGEEDDDPGTIRDASFQIVRAGFCLEPRVGVSFPFEPPYIEILHDVMQRAETCWEWSNQHFDSVRLAKSGLRARRWGSGMWMWHFYKSDLPKALGFVAPLVHNGPPWKNKAQEAPAWYNAMDHVIQNAIRLYVKQQLEAEGRWNWFWRHGVEADEILVKMCKPGFFIDRNAQQVFADKVRLDRDASEAALNEAVPVAAKKVKRWKSTPRDLTDVLIEPTGEFKKNGKEVCRYSKVLLFNPNSSQQVASLIKSLGLKVPFNRKAGRETTEAKHLKKLVSKHPIFRTLLDCREKNKMLTTYIWPTDAEGRVFTHYGFNPSTWRKSSYQVNSQNIPKRSDLAQQFRRMIVARPGHQFVAVDSSAIEAVLVGYFAGSARYIRLARVGVHDWVTSYKVGRPISLDLPDAEMKAACKAIKKEFPEVREMIKRVVHLSNYKGTPGRIVEEYPEYFRNEKEARDLQELYLSTPPGKDVVAWQNATLTLAHKEHVLKTPFGYWHEFYSVFAWDSIYKTFRLSDDSKRCIAFRPQATASAIQTEVLLWVRDHHPWLLPFLRLIVHDETVAEVPDAQVDEAVKVMYDGFTQSWPQLDGLWIGCEAKVGRNVANWSLDNPDGLRTVA